MTEDKLNALKDLPAPPPRTEARSAALAAAMAAFDAGAENIAGEPQGKADAASPMQASQSKRRQKMRAVLYRIAAGIAVIVVATPAALYVIDQYSPNAVYDSGTAVVDRLTSAEAPAEQLKQKSRNDRLGDATGKVVVEADARDGTVATKLQSPPEPSTAKTDQSSAQSQPPAASADQNAPADAKRKDAPKKETRTRVASESGPAAPPAAIVTEPGFSVQEKSKPAPRDGETSGGAANARQGLVSLTLSEPSARGVDVTPSSRAQVTTAREQNHDKFEAKESNSVKQVAAEPVSTFSIDVDTASYAFVRRALNAGHLPPKDAVRVEEMINYFPYDYPRPETADAPFQPTVTVVPAPWRPTNKLIHIGIKGYDLVARERPRANLVFLIDVSGSMHPQDRLPLLKNAFRMLVEELQPEDTVGIVTYASGSGVALEPTRAAQKEKILDAIDALGAGGSTAGAQGIADAYRLAEAHFYKGGVNRIILATDGDFNVGISDPDALKGFVERKRQAGIFLSVLGVGQGDYNDALMQVLAQNGNGNAAYVDTLNEARKVLVDEASSTLFTIAKDVKIQLEFNPAQVSEYRLIGYETRALRREDFNNDKVDAGEIGSGHTVTAIYEVTPANAPKLVDDLRYRKAEADAPASTRDGELGFLRLRYKLPNEDASKLIGLPITTALEKPEIAAAPDDVRFSVAVAAFGQLLRGQPYLQSYSYDEALALAQTARGADPYGYRAEFLNLLRLVKSARP